MQLTVDRHHYDYFGGACKHEYKHFTNLLEGWNAYKRTQAKDYDYGDAWQHTTCFATLDHTVVAKPQRPHARTKSEWLALKVLMDKRVEVADDDGIDIFADLVDDLPF